MPLTSEEKALAAEIGFDEKVLEIIKNCTQSSFKKIDMNSMGEVSGGQEYVSNNDSEEFKNEQIANLEKIAAKYPELKDCVSKDIQLIKNPPEIPFPFGKKNSEQAKQFEEKNEILKRYQPYLRQQLDELKSQLPAGMRGNMMIAPPQAANNEELLAMLKKEFDGKPLADKYKPVDGLLFNIPVDRNRCFQSEFFQGKAQLQFVDAQGKKKDILGSEERDDGMHIFHTPNISMDSTDKIREELNKKLHSLGYTVYGAPSIKRSAHFVILSEAENFAKSITNPMTNVEIVKSHPFSSVSEYDPGKVGVSSDPASGGLHIPPMATVEKVSANQWKITTSPSYTVQTILLQATVGKDKKGDSASNFNALVAAETSGPNYGVDTNMVIEKVKKWDKLYGVQLLNAEADRFSISFAKLPDDLSHLCTEMWLFCPDLIDIHSGHYERKAIMMRDFANKLKDSKKVSFWWD